MRIQIIALAIASTIAVQVAVSGNERDFPRYESPRRDNRPVYRNDSRYDNRDNQIRSGYEYREERVRDDYPDRQFFDDHFTIRETPGNGVFETVKGFVVKNNKNQENSKDDKVERWTTNVVDITETANIPFVVVADEKLKEEKKEVKEHEKIIKKDVELLKKVEKVESQPLNQEQAKKAAQLEEKIIDQINREQKKIGDIKADEQNLKNLKTITNEAAKINEQLTKKAEAEKKDVPVDPVTAEFDRKMKLNLAFEQAQKHILPSLLKQLQKELRRETDNQKGAATQVVNNLGAQLRIPDPKEIIVTQPLTPATPLSEKITLVVQKSQRDRKGNANIVGASN